MLKVLHNGVPNYEYEDRNNYLPGKSQNVLKLWYLARFVVSAAL